MSVAYEKASFLTPLTTGSERLIYSLNKKLLDLERDRDRLLCRRMPLGAASPTAFAQNALTELRPLGLGSSELGGLFGGGGGGGGGVT